MGPQRGLLSRGPLAVLLAGLLLLVSACSTGTPSAQQHETLTYGLVGSANDIMQPWPLQRNTSQTVFSRQVFEGLTELSADGSVEYVLAESMEPNEALDVWTIRLREGVKFHDGTELGADDVVASVLWMLDPDNQFPPATQISMVDPAGVRKLDDLTIEMSLNRPYGPFPQAWSFERLTITSAESGAAGSTGTGPWQVESFVAQEQAVFTRNADYWRDQPGFDRLSILSFPDQASMVNALRAGQIDVAHSVPYTEIQDLAAASNLTTTEAPAVGGPTLSMRTDEPPFGDPRVREAFQLLMDREQIVENAAAGYAEVGNDMNVRATNCVAPDVPQRVQDQDRARSLLAEAGAETLEVELVTDGAIPGMMEIAQLFAQQAASVGVTVTVRQLDVATFLAKYREWPFSVGLSGGDYLTMIPLYYQPGGEQNITRFDDAEYNELADALFTTRDENSQCELVTRMLQIEHERGGDMVPMLNSEVVVHNVRVVGLTPNRWGRTAYDFAGVTLNDAAGEG